MIADDDPVTYRFVEATLTREGYEVYVADNGKRALEIMKGISPDLVITDVVMPEMHGYEFYKRIRFTKRTSKIPIFVMTGSVPISKVFAQFDIDDYLLKPIQADKLIKKVKDLLKYGVKKKRKITPAQMVFCAAIVIIILGASFMFRKLFSYMGDKKESLKVSSVEKSWRN